MTDTRSSPGSDELVAALERVIGHDPKMLGLSYDTVEQLLSSAAQAARDLLGQINGVAQAAPVRPACDACPDPELCAKSSCLIYASPPSPVAGEALAKLITRAVLDVMKVGGDNLAIYQAVASSLSSTDRGDAT